MDAVRGPLVRVTLAAGAVSFVAVLGIGGLTGERTGNAQPVPNPLVVTTPAPTATESSIDPSVVVDSRTNDSTGTATPTTTTPTPTPTTGPTAKSRLPRSVDGQVTFTVKIRAQDNRGELIPLKSPDGFDVTVPQDSPNGSTQIPTTVTSTVTPLGEIEATVQAPASQSTQVCVSFTPPNWQLAPGDGVNSEWIAQPDRGSCRTVTEPNGKTIDAVVVHS